MNALRRAYHQALAAVAAVETRPLWRDVSAYQGAWNAGVAAANRVYGVIVRAGYGLVLDARFSANYAAAGAAGLLRSSYWALYPDVSWMAQLDLWYRTHPERDVVPRAIDLELARGVSAARIAQITLQMAEEIQRRDGVYPILYSRASLVNSWLSSWSDGELNRFYWWLAQYLLSGAEHPGPPTPPARVRPERIILHQTSDHKPGFVGEAESRSVDWDRWQCGGLAGMFDVIREWGGAARPALTLDERVARLEEAVFGASYDRGCH